jgi:hypothetical protein
LLGRCVGSQGEGHSPGSLSIFSAF